MRLEVSELVQPCACGAVVMCEPRLAAAPSGLSGCPSLGLLEARTREVDGYEEVLQQDCNPAKQLDLCVALTATHRLRAPTLARIVPLNAFRPGTKVVRQL